MPDNPKLQTTYVLGKHSIVGYARQSWEDRVFVDFVPRLSGDPLIVAMVADGVGGGEAGSRAAHLAIDEARQAVQASAPDKSIPEVIEDACFRANRVVHHANQQDEDRQGQTTLVIAIIHNDRLYVGNIGDSRAYWVTPQGKLLQLTKDHTFYNIHGGSPTAPNAGAVVNAIGLKQHVEVDLGIYLQPGISKEKAYQIGYAGIALRPGDSVILCSDGLIKTDNTGQRFVSDEEIVQALQTEYQADKAAIKMVSVAEGRRPNDNVSAVTIQCFSNELLGRRRAIPPSQSANRLPLLTAVVALLTIFLIGVGALAFFLTRQAATPAPTLTLVPVTSTLTATHTLPPPTATPTEVINPGQARVEEIRGTGANVRMGQYLSPGASIVSSTDGIKVVLGTQQGRASLVYWLGGSAGILNFDANRANPVLENGALCLNPQEGKAEVRFNQPALENVAIWVESGRMVVELLNNEIWVYCFSGDCLIDPGGNADLFKIPEENKRAYFPLENIAKPGETMAYAEKLSWYKRSLDCLTGLVATPTPAKLLPLRSLTPTRKSDAEVPSSSNTPVISTTVAPKTPVPTTPVPTTPVPTTPAPTTPAPPPITPTTETPPPYPSE